MALLTAAIIDAVSTDADALRRVYQLLAGGTPGVIGDGDLKVTAGSGMQSVVAAGMGLVKGTQNTVTQGFYGVTNDANVTQTHATADPTNPRNDLVIVQVRDAFYSGANKDVIAAIVTGTPAPSPSDPTPPANSLVLARVRVNAGAGTIGTITDLRPRIGSALHAEVYLAASPTITSGVTTIVPYDTVLADPNGNFTTGSSAKYTCPKDGRYRVSAAVLWNNFSGGQSSDCIAQKNGTDALRFSTLILSVTANKSQIGSGVIRCVSGDQLTVTVIQTSGVNQTLFGGQSLCWAQFEYVGPL